MEEHTPATDHIRAIHVTARQTDRHIQTKEHHSLVGAAEGSASRVSARFRSRIFWKTMVLWLIDHGVSVCQPHMVSSPEQRGESVRTGASHL